MSRTLDIRWQDWSGEGLEHLSLREAPDGISAASVILGPPVVEVFAARYRILCDVSWRVRRLEVSLTRARALERRRRPLDGHPGAPRPDLEGAMDVDLSATPFTNTLPIRRLGLGSGQSETIQVVYVRLPDLTVSIDRQRYTCLEPGRRYRYESVDSRFIREIEVDDDGLIVTYPGLFRRVL